MSPNWCHDRLTVEGPKEDLDRFIDEVRLLDDNGVEVQPLSFAKHVPEPSEEVYAAIEESQKVPCDLCGGRGVRPVTEVEARDFGARWDPVFDKLDWMREQIGTPVDQRKPCNFCLGEGRKVPFGGGWYGWCIEHWGTKWDASFGGPFIAAVQDGGDPHASVAAQTRYVHENRVLYRFDTAWSPPTAWLARVVGMFPTLFFVLSYGEPGNGFAGEITAHGDEYNEVEKSLEDVLSPEDMWF